MLYAEIIVPMAVPINYTWSVPQQWENAAKPGTRVEVQLRNKHYAGIIKKTTRDKPLAFDPKPLLNILDEEPMVHLEQLALWEWIAQYYLCTEGDVMQAAVPSNLKLTGESILIWNEASPYELTDGHGLTDNEFLLAQALEIKKELKLNEVQQLLDMPNPYPIVKRLIEKQICFVWEELREKFKPKTDVFVLLHPMYRAETKLAEILNDGLGKAPKQTELLLAYLHLSKTEGDVTQAALLKKASATSAQLKGLVSKGILTAEKRIVDRNKTIKSDLDFTFELSLAQQTALNETRAVLSEKNVCLLHGVTASGKTQVFIKLLEEYLSKGKQALYMLPEIGLTAQMIRRLQVYFGSHIAIYHSKFNPNERVEIWNRVKTGNAKIVLGARSALFLPFKDLGLIIVDEEHDGSYKQQDPAPRYQARDTAIYYASLFNAKVVLGSATPSIESYWNATEGKYGLVTLKERYGNVAMPAINITDLKALGLNPKEKTAISPPMFEAIKACLDAKGQVILFQNRRGYSPYTQCITCGWIPQCKQCNVSLTYHKAKNKMACHYCGSVYPLITTCTACGSHGFSQKNFGTEKLEEIVAGMFLGTKTARMDHDTVKGKNEQDNLIKSFEQRKLDILVGTQMVVKGLDFENVQLVGIVDGDGLLNFSDYKVNERAFQLMEQVSGRAGRKDGKGSVAIQVNNPHHPVLTFLQNHDFAGLFQFEIEGRKRFGYPPFSRIIILTFKHRDPAVAEAAAAWATDYLRQQFGPYLNGPAQPPVDKVRNLYIWETMAKLPKDKRCIADFKKKYKDLTAALHAIASFRGILIAADVDPS